MNNLVNLDGGVSQLTELVEMMISNGIEFNDIEKAFINNSRPLILTPWFDGGFLNDKYTSEVYIGGESKWDFPCEALSIIDSKLNNAISWLAYECGNNYCYSYGERFEDYMYIIDTNHNISIPPNASESFQGFVLIRNTEDLIDSISLSFDFDIGSIPDVVSAIEQNIFCRTVVDSIMSCLMDNMPHLFENGYFNICEITPFK